MKGNSVASDKALRGKYVFLVLAQAMAFMRESPSRNAVEIRIDSMQELNPTLEMPDDSLFSKPGAVLGRMVTMAHNIIYNFELRDYRDRKSEEASVGTRV